MLSQTIIRIVNSGIEGILCDHLWREYYESRAQAAILVGPLTNLTYSNSS